MESSDSGRAAGRAHAAGFTSGCQSERSACRDGECRQDRAVVYRGRRKARNGAGSDRTYGCRVSCRVQCGWSRSRQRRYGGRDSIVEDCRWCGSGTAARTYRRSVRAGLRCGRSEAVFDRRRWNVADLAAAAGGGKADRRSCGAGACRRSGRRWHGCRHGRCRRKSADCSAGRRGGTATIGRSGRSGFVGRFEC